MSCTMPFHAPLERSIEHISQALDSLEAMGCDLMDVDPKITNKEFSNSQDYMAKVTSISKKVEATLAQFQRRYGVWLTKTKLLIKPAKRLIASCTTQHRTSGTREHGSNAKSSSTSSGGSNDPDSPRSSNLNPLATSALSSFISLQYLLSAFYNACYKITCYVILHAVKPDNTISLDLHTAQPHPLGDCILRLKEVIVKTGLSRSMIYVKMDETSPYYDPTFPQKIKLGLRSIGFFESEVNHWISQLKNTQTNKGGL